MVFGHLLHGKMPAATTAVKARRSWAQAAINAGVPFDSTRCVGYFPKAKQLQGGCRPPATRATGAAAIRRKRILPLKLKTNLATVFIFLLVLAATQSIATQYTRTDVKYAMPNVTLLDQDGEPVHLPSIVEDGKVVLVDFIYATCTTICPVLSAGFANFQDRLGGEASDVTLLSFTIDPDADRPAELKVYSQRYDAKPGWHFLTGTRKDIDKVMNAFDAYVGNKMDHMPLTFIKAPGSDQWARIYGLISTKDLIKEYRTMTGGSR